MIISLSTYGCGNSQILLGTKDMTTLYPRLQLTAR